MSTEERFFRELIKDVNNEDLKFDFFYNSSDILKIIDHFLKDDKKKNEYKNEILQLIQEKFKNLYVNEYIKKNGKNVTIRVIDETLLTGLVQNLKLIKRDLESKITHNDVNITELMKIINNYLKYGSIENNELKNKPEEINVIFFFKNKKYKNYTNLYQGKMKYYNSTQYKDTNNDIIFNIGSIKDIFNKFKRYNLNVEDEKNKAIFDIQKDLNEERRIRGGKTKYKKNSKYKRKTMKNKKI
jgi:hypothetical protein